MRLLKTLAVAALFLITGTSHALEEISSSEAPKAVGPYSQAIRSNGFVFLSGQIPISPKNGNIAGQGIAEQTHQVMRNLAAVLEAAGLGFSDVVATTVYLNDIDHFAEMNAVYGEYFGKPAPARATIQAARLPKGVLIEVSAIAVVNR